MTTIRFNEIGRRVEKSGICSKCGKRRKRTKRFWQTLNPFNQKKDGTIKTAHDIRTEVDAAAAKWLLEPLVCASCENGGPA